MDTGLYVININGQDTTLLFAMTATRLWQEKMAENEYTIDASGNISEVGMSYLIYFGYKNYCIANELKQELKYNDFYHWSLKTLRDPSTVHILSEIVQCFRESQLEGDKEEKPEAKKKATKK